TRELMKQVEESDEVTVQEPKSEDSGVPIIPVEEELLSRLTGNLTEVLPLKEGKRIGEEIERKAQEIKGKMEKRVAEEQKKQEREERESIELRAEYAKMTDTQNKKKRGLFGRKGRG